mmetsp:Transcript_11045/g.12639  ORF Transcript_11045/g.12639 Transcript_11045/m.12639 type:complete len:390 (-) Transcript_11045:6-1175(-)
MQSSTVSKGDAQTLVPASVLRQLRAAAAVRCYDIAFVGNRMDTKDLKKQMYNNYHGNKEKNIISQIALIVNAKAEYKNIYEIETVKLLQQAPIESYLGGHRKCVLKELFSPPSAPYRFVAGKHFDYEVLCCPTKILTAKKCSGRFLLELARKTITNLKKAVVIADAWLDNGDLPSGKTWNDLYVHTISKSFKNNPKEPIFTGLINLICHSKFNEGRSNILNVLATKDGDSCDFDTGGKAKLRSVTKENKSNLRSTQTGTPSQFVARGLTLESRIQIIELAQFEDSKKSENCKDRLTLLTTRNQLLLEERKQEIELAKIICPTYDPTQPNWMKIKNLTTQIEKIKNDISRGEEEQRTLHNITTSSDLASEFLDSVCNSPTKKRKASNNIL